LGICGVAKVIKLPLEVKAFLLNEKRLVIIFRFMRMSL